MVTTTDDIKKQSKPAADKLDGIELRRRHRGLIGIQPKVPVRDVETLSLVYTPGVAKPCLEIARDRLTSFDYTMRGNTVAIVSDGSSVYGLGNVGAKAAIPMLEAKSVFHKNLAGIDGFPIALDTQEIDGIVETLRILAPTFGGIHLEDISSPRCFAIEERLKRAISLPVFHPDQHGSAIGVLAALTNALKVVGKKFETVRVVINGAGAAGIATAKMLKREGVKDVKVLDRHGVLSYHRTEGLNWIKSEVARQTNPEDRQGDLSDVIAGADVFIGFSAPDILTPQMVQSMAKDPIVFALALPAPEIQYEEAKNAGARVVVTSLSGAPNQLNSSVVYPGVFRGTLDVRATEINATMRHAAACALASLVSDSELSADMVLPAPLDKRISASIARAVAQAALETGVAQCTDVTPESIEAKVKLFVEKGQEALVPPASGKTQSRDEEALELRKRYQGMMGMKVHIPLEDEAVYKAVYSLPEAAHPSEYIKDHPEAVYDLTLKNNLVGIVTDGSAVLGLGNIGPAAGMPVMEGKAILFKTFGGVEGVPICLRTQEVDDIVAAVKAIAPVFGGINLEDIAAPRCFDVERRLSEELDIPVFHDDQHGTAVVVLAGTLNAVKLAGKKLSDVSIVVNGGGAAALSVSKLLMKAGVQHITICDSQGAIYKGRPHGMNPFKDEIAEITNLERQQGKLADVMKGADMFLGLSVPKVVDQAMVKSMAPNPIIFALSNPTPEIMPDEAYAAGARVVATGRSDFANQVNNSLAFPGIFRGALDVQARQVTDDMKVAAAFAIADMVSEEQIAENVIIPAAFDFRVPPAVARAVAKAAMDGGVARKPMNPDEIAAQLAHFIAEGTLRIG